MSEICIVQTRCTNSMHSFALLRGEHFICRSYKIHDFGLLLRLKLYCMDVRTVSKAYTFHSEKINLSASIDRLICLLFCWKIKLNED